MDKKYYRKLSAILFADIQGYTALMQNNEKAAREQLLKFKKVFTDVTKQYEGQIIQFYGDGCLCVFQSSVNAISCAVEIQIKFLTEPKIPVRIGMDRGDIFFEEGNVFGDSVNIAARIQSVSEPGSIVVSERVRKDLLNHHEIELVSFGKHRFKNVNDPIEIFGVNNKNILKPDLKKLNAATQHQANVFNTSEHRKLYKQGTLISILLIFITSILFLYLRSSISENNKQDLKHDNTIAVLPFKDLSPMGDQQYFSDGIADEILSHLASIDELKVIARSTSFAFKDQKAPISLLKQKFGVDYVVEGSVKKEGENIFITVALVETESESSIWAERFERKLENTMEIQRDIARTISFKLEPEIPQIRLTHSIKQSTKNFEAFDHYLMAKHATKNYLPDSSIKLLEKAIELDSTFANAYNLMAWNYTIIGIAWNDFPLKTAHREALNAIKHSLQLAPERSESHLIFGGIKFHFELDFEEAEKQFEKAFGVGEWPNSPSSFCFCSYIHLLMQSSRYDKAHDLLLKVIEIDPNYHRKNSDMGLLNYFKENWIEAELYLSRGISEKAGAGRAVMYLAKLYIIQENYDAALKLLNQNMAKSERHPEDVALLAVVYSRTNQIKKFEELKSELKERYTNNEKKIEFALATLYTGINDKNSALNWLKISYDINEPELTALKVDPYYKELQNEVIYRDLLKEMKII